MVSNIKQAMADWSNKNTVILTAKGVYSMPPRAGTSIKKGVSKLPTATNVLQSSGLLYQARLVCAIRWASKRQPLMKLPDKVRGHRWRHERDGLCSAQP